MLTFCPFNFFLFLKTLLLVFYLANFTILGLTLSSLGAPDLCIRSNSSSFFSSHLFSFKASIKIWSVFSFLFSGSPWINKEFLQGYCSSISKLTLHDCMEVEICLICFCIFFIIFSYSTFSLSFSSNFSDI